MSQTNRKEGIMPLITGPEGETLYVLPPYFELKERQPDFGVHHIRSVDDLEEGSSYLWFKEGHERLVIVFLHREKGLLVFEWTWGYQKFLLKLQPWVLGLEVAEAGIMVSTSSGA